MMEDTAARFEDIVRQALAQYGMQGCALAFIRHSDNVTYKVESPGAGAYLLRIHVPVVAAMGSHGSDPQAIRSELAWLEALSRDTDLVLQQPVRNRAGELVTRISPSDGGAPVHCTLLHWVAGQPYHRDLESEDTARQIGTILARLHLHAAQWERPEGFVRPRRDLAYFQGVLRDLWPAVADARIGRSDYAELEKSIGTLGDMMRSMDDNRQTWGIIHADAHKGNLLYQAGEIGLIDFSFCALGSYMFDVAVCLSDMKPALHRAFVGGYQRLRNLPAGYQRLVEGFFLGAMVGTFALWIPNPRAQGVLATKVPQIARDYATKLNRGEHFWLGER